jgi:hypothetical protein
MLYDASIKEAQDFPISSGQQGFESPWERRKAGCPAGNLLFLLRLES